MRNSHYSPFLLLETPGFSELLWAPTPGPPLSLCPGDLTAPPDLQLARAMTFACRHDIIINPTNFLWWWFEEGGGGESHKIFINREGGSTIFLLFPGGIKNLTESFIPFLPHPRELKNDNSLNSIYEAHKITGLSASSLINAADKGNAIITRRKDKQRFILYWQSIHERCFEIRKEERRLVRR